MTDIERRWRKTGLLEGNEGFDAETLANNLDECSNMLMQNPVNEKSKQVAEIILPIVVRLFNEKGIRSIDVEHLYQKVTKSLDEMGKLTFHEEAEFVLEFTENYSQFE
jgi:hypothetical protein